MAQRMAKDAIPKTRFETGVVRGGIEGAQLVDAFVGEDVIRIERQHPFGSDTGLIDRVIPLPLMAVEGTHEQPRIVELPHEHSGTIGAAAVDNDDLGRPAQALENACDIGLLVVGEDDRRDLIEAQIRLPLANVQVCGTECRCPVPTICAIRS